MKADFVIDRVALMDIKVPAVELSFATENLMAEELTMNCGCSGRCLSTTT